MVQIQSSVAVEFKPSRPKGTELKEHFVLKPTFETSKEDGENSSSRVQKKELVERSSGCPGPNCRAIVMARSHHFTVQQGLRVKPDTLGHTRTTFLWLVLENLRSILLGPSKRQDSVSRLCAWYCWRQIYCAQRAHMSKLLVSISIIAPKFKSNFEGVTWLFTNILAQATSDEVTQRNVRHCKNVSQYCIS